MCTVDLVGQGRLTTILTNKVNGARDEPNFDFIEFVYPKKRGKKKIIIFLAPLMAEIEMVSIVVKRP